MKMKELLEKDVSVEVIATFRDNTQGVVNWKPCVRVLRQRKTVARVLKQVTAARGPLAKLSLCVDMTPEEAKVAFAGSWFLTENGKIYFDEKGQVKP